MTTTNNALNLTANSSNQFAIGAATGSPAGPNFLDVYGAGAFGTYAGTAAPTNGLIVSGQSAFGNAAPQSTDFFEVLMNGPFARCAHIGGTSTVDDPLGNVQTGLLLDPSFEPVAGHEGNCATLRIQSETLMSSNLNTNTGIEVNMVSRGPFTIFNNYGIHVKPLSHNLGALSNFSYGLYVEDPSFGSHTTAIYADNMSIGITGQSPPTNGLIVNGQGSIGGPSNFFDTFLVAGLSTCARVAHFGGNLMVDTGAPSHQQAGLVIDAAFRPVTANNGNCLSLYLNPRVTMSGNLNSYAGLQVFLKTAGPFTLANSYGVYVQPGSTLASPSITNAYGIFANTPVAGTNRMAIYGDNMSIGYPTSSPPTNSLIVSGKIGVGINTNMNAMVESFCNGLYTNAEFNQNGLQTSTGHTTGTDYTLYMGADSTNRCSYIQSAQWNTAHAPLFLNGGGSDVVCGPGAISSTGTIGYLFISDCSGTPTGSPTNSFAGRVPLVYDSANNLLWIYNGSAWKGFQPAF